MSQPVCPSIRMSACVQELVSVNGLAMVLSLVSDGSSITTNSPNGNEDHMDVIIIMVITGAILFQGKSKKIRGKYKDMDEEERQLCIEILAVRVFFIIKFILCISVCTVKLCHEINQSLYI